MSRVQGHGGEPMAIEPDFPRPENRTRAPVWPQAEAPQDGAILPAGNVPQSQAGKAALPRTRSPFDFGRLRPGDLIAGIASFLVLISLFSRGTVSRPLPTPRRLMRLSRSGS